MALDELLKLIREADKKENEVPQDYDKNVTACLLTWIDRKKDFANSNYYHTHAMLKITERENPEGELRRMAVYDFVRAKALKDFFDEMDEHLRLFDAIGLDKLGQFCPKDVVMAVSHYLLCRDILV